jgi:6-phospho-beta-glucosidase
LAVKLAVIGAASSYSPELIDGLFGWLEKIPFTEVWMMDPQEDRLAITSDFARRMAARHGNPFSIHATSDMRAAVKDASFVVTQIRVGGIHARIADEKLGLRHGIVGQETTGVGGFACALRTIPPVLAIARAMEEVAPKGVLVNFTNPSGIVSEALFKHSSITSVGLCNVPIGIIMEVVKKMNCAMEDVELDYVGLNHLSWIRRFSVKGQDVTEPALAAFLDKAEEEWEQAPIRENMVEAIQRLHMFLNGYLQYYYATSDVLEYLRAKEKTRGEEVLEVEKTLFEKYRQPDLDVKPEELSKRGGAHYSTAAFHLISAIHNDTGNRQIVCCRNDGAIPTFDDDVAIEVPAVIGKHGARAVAQAAPAPIIRGLMQAVKAYETLTVEAAVTGNRDAAFQAVLAHPLMPGAKHARELLTELLDINKPHLIGTFF